MKVLCLRHGETNYNLLGLCNDDPGKDVHLTERGRQQAAQAAERLKDYPIERIVCSPLPRTRQTADIINRYHQAPVQVHPDIHDLRSGFDSRPVADYYACIDADPLHLQPPGGESLWQHRERVLRFIDWLKSQDADCLLVIAHEETLRVFRAEAEGLPPEAMRGMAFRNCELYEFEV